MSKLYDVNGNELTMIDLQDKGKWCVYGQRKEIVFLEHFGDALGLQLNPVFML